MSEIPNWIQSQQMGITEESNPNFLEPEIMEKIEDGQGLEVIENIGWEKYRQTLEQVPYARIFEKRSQKIQGINQNAPEDNWVTSHHNIDADKRAGDLSRKFQSGFTKDTGNPFIVEIEGDTKLWVHGSESNPDNKKFLRRIYLDIPTQNLPEVFDLLSNSLIENDLMRHIQIAMNLESFDDSDQYSASNAIVIYISGDKPELMTKIAEIISQVKQDNEDLFTRPDWAKALATKAAVGELMIPLDDDIAFVEQTGEASYHAQILPQIYKELGLNLGVNSSNLDDLYRNIKPFSAQRPGELNPDNSILVGRKKYSPALILDANLRNT